MEASTSLSGQCAVLTGASSGIGAAIARDLSAQGVDLVLVARRGELLEALAGELPGKSAVLVADVAVPETPQAMLDLATTTFGKADILINNAGIYRGGFVGTFEPAVVDLLTETNFSSAVRATYLFAAHMKERGSGSIVNLSSIGSQMFAPGMGIYCGLKRALEIFTDAIRHELRGSGIKVGFVAPGSTATEVFDHTDETERPGLKGWKESAMDPAHVARAVRFLLEQGGNALVPHLRIYTTTDLG